MQATVVKTSTIEITDALAQMGLVVEDVTEAILRGELARDSCTANDAPGAPGFYAWAGTVRALRDILMPRGWDRNDDICYSRVISPDKSIAIAVVTGDDGTGNRNVSPKTKYAKGAATQAAVSCNQRTFWDAALVEDETAATWATWMLLKKRKGDSAFAELSLPSSMTKDGQVESWHTRIILNPILVDPNINIDDDSSEPPIDVLVRRRS